MEIPSPLYIFDIMDNYNIYVIANYLKTIHNNSAYL